MSKSTNILLALALVAGAPALAQEQEGGPALVLRGATVHGPAGPIERGVVVVRAGRIVAVGKEGEVAVPEDAERVVLPGQHLHPGLIDCDTVLGLTEIGSVRATNDTDEVGKVNPNLRAELSVNPDSELFPVARQGGVLLAVTALRSGLVSGTGALITTEGWTWEEMTVRAPLWLHVRWPSMRLDRTGAARKKLDEQQAERERALRALDEMLEDARAYWRARQAPGGKRPELDPKWEAMRDVVERRIPVAVEADTPTQLRAALDWSERHSLRLVIVGGAEAWRLAGALAEADVPVILGPTHTLPAREDDPQDAAFKAPAVLHQAGVRLAFSTGGNAFATANARNLRLHAATAVAHGLPREVALRALTLGAAEILGVAEKLGSIEPGKDATFFSCDGDLLETPTKVTAAWLQGRPMTLEDRQKRLWERYRERPRRE